MNAQEQLKHQEQISALADGQLNDAEFAATVEWVMADDEARASWHAYHLVGDVLRSAELAAGSRDRDFLARLNRRLQVESRVSRFDAGHLDAPESIAIERQYTLGSDKNSQVFRGTPAAANDGVFRWKLVAGFASLAAVAVISWGVMGLLDRPAGDARLAQLGRQPATAEASVPLPDGALQAAGPPVMIRDPRLDELMAAHRQFGGTSALQNPSGFLRNATFEEGGR